LRAAEQECRNHNHYYIGAEHILFALLEEHDPAVQARLHDEHIDSAEVHAHVRRALGTGEDHSWEGILITPRVRKIIQIAEVNAAGRHVDPIDLFAALREEGGGQAAEILRQVSRSAR